MEELFKCRESLQLKLGRNLKEDELKFIKWVYERYIEENLEKDLESTENIS